MLLRHSFYYLFARGLPGLVSFAALALYSRLLTADEFGRYALVLAGIGLVDVMVFQWLRLLLARFVPAHQDSPHSVQQAILALFLSLAAIVCALGLALIFLWTDPVWRALIVLALPLTLAQAWLQVDITLASVQLQPARYGRLLGGKSMLALLLGGWLAWMGLGAQAPLIGLLAGSVLAWLVFGVTAWRGVRPHWPARPVLQEFRAYGLPLVVTFALGWVIASSDRVLIAWLLDEAAAGLYAVGYDLAQQSLGLALVVVNTAAYPLAVSLLEKNGQQAASAQLSCNGELIVTLAMAGAAGLIALAPAIIEVFIGREFRAGALAVMPWIAAAAAVAGIKAFHLDMAFHLARQSRWLVITSTVAALANVVLNLLLIPRYGILGAAWATLAAFAVAALASGVFGRNAFSMPAFLPLLARGFTVSVLVYLGAWLVMQVALGVLLTLLLGVAAGAALGLGGALLLDVAGVRKSLSAQVHILGIWKANDPS